MSGPFRYNDNSQRGYDDRNYSGNNQARYTEDRYQSQPDSRYSEAYSMTTSKGHYDQNFERQSAIDRSYNQSYLGQQKHTNRGTKNSLTQQAHSLPTSQVKV